MKSRTTARFRDALRALPSPVRKQARAAFRLFQRDPHHPSLRFRLIHPSQSIYSARISLHYRALAVLEGDVFIWFWVGSHSDYDRLVSHMGGQ